MTPAEILRHQEQALQNCRKCKLCEGRSRIVFGSGNPRAELVVIAHHPLSEVANGSSSPLGRRDSARRAVGRVRLIEQREDVGVCPRACRWRG